MSVLILIRIPVCDDITQPIHWMRAIVCRSFALKMCINCLN